MLTINSAVIGGFFNEVLIWQQVRFIMKKTWSLIHLLLWVIG